MMHYSVYFWLIRSFTDPAFTGSIFVCGPLHHHVLQSSYSQREFTDDGMSEICRKYVLASKLNKEKKMFLEHSKGQISLGHEVKFYLDPFNTT